MLSRAHRMVDPADFSSTLRKGRRSGNPMVVVHCRTDEASNSSLVGFVVPKREIPLATRRNRVKRQLRHLMRQRVPAMPAGSRVVIRALKGSQDRTSTELADALDRAIGRACRREAGAAPSKDGERR